MFHKSEIVLMEKKLKELYSVMSSVNDIYILSENLGHRSPHPDYILAIKNNFYIHIFVIRQNLVQA